MNVTQTPTLQTHAARNSKNTDNKSVAEQSANVRNQFPAAALSMSWQLAVAVLVPILAGAKLDRVFSTGSTCTFIGLGLALIASVMVVWRAMQAANRLPVPKLTAAQKRAIKKLYEAEDKDE